MVFNRYQRIPLSIQTQNKKGKITIPMHRGDLALKTANSILKQAGLK